MTKVYVAILNQGAIHTGLADFLVKLFLSEGRGVAYDLNLTFPSKKPASHNRNQIVKDFLATDADYLLMIDADIVPTRNPLDLAALDLDVVAAPCPQWNSGDIYWVVMDKVPGGYRAAPPERRNGLREADAVGTGCILIARRGLEGVKAPFMRRWDEDGLAVLGHDFFFCEKAREAGFKVWAHWDYPCDHFKEGGVIQTLELVNKYVPT